MPSSNQRLKLLHLAQILFTETDEDHGITMPQIIEKLAERGVDAERKSLYKDIALLDEFGLGIEKLRTSPVSYAVVQREFSAAELTLLADAVQSSRFLTARKAASLTKSIKTLGSKHQAKDLSRRLHVEGRIKMQNESVFYNVDAIQRAIAAKRKVRFKYFRYGVDKERTLQHGGDPYVETPVQMTYSDDCYYLIAFNDKHSGFAHYRVDRMLDVEVTDEPATRNADIAAFDIAEYQARAFGMFSGEPMGVTMLVREEAMSAVIDRFGSDVQSAKAAEGVARVHAMVMESPTFFGWLAQFGDKVSIEKPTSLRNAYVSFLKGIVDSYK